MLFYSFIANVCFPIVTLAVLGLPQPENVECDIVEGEVTAFWQHPVGDPSNFKYNVQMAKYVAHHTLVFFYEI